MFLQWCVLVPGVADPDPVDGEVDGDGDGDDVECADVVDVTDDVEPLVAAMATPAAPAPMPAARNAVIIRRRARPPLVDLIWLPPSCQCPGRPTTGPLWLQHGQRTRRQPEA
jgi:hypothetical protein